MALYSQRKLWLSLASLLSLFCTPSEAEAQTLRTAKSANALINSIGINTHFTYPDTPYLGSFSEAKQKLLELNIRHIRDGVAQDSYKYEPMRNLCDSGIRLHSGVSERVEGYRGALDFDKSRVASVDDQQGTSRADIDHIEIIGEFGVLARPVCVTCHI